MQLASDGDILNEYNRDGKPVWMANRREGGIAHTYLYLGNQLVATQIYDAATNPVLYQTTDTLGSVIAQTNQDAWVDHFNYYQAWGGLQSGSLDDGPGYANQINDTNTGLSYAQQRYYDTSVGRFMSMDPVDANTVTGGNFNRYVYANDNPYRFTDPDGRQECTAGREQTNEHCGPPPTTTGCLTTGCSGSANVSVTIVDNSYRRGEQASSQGGAATESSVEAENSTQSYAIGQYEKAFGQFDSNSASSHVYTVGPIQTCSSGPNCGMNAALHCNVPTGCSSTAVKTGDVMFAGPGWVSVNVDYANHTITNVTTWAHALNPGVVSIDVIQRGDTGSVIFTGVGAGLMPDTNDYLSQPVWQHTAAEMSAWSAENH